MSDRQHDYERTVYRTVTEMVDRLRAAGIVLSTLRAKAPEPEIAELLFVAQTLLGDARDALDPVLAFHKAPSPTAFLAASDGSKATPGRKDAVA